MDYMDVHQRDRIKGKFLTNMLRRKMLTINDKLKVPFTAFGTGIVTLAHLYYKLNIIMADGISGDGDVCLRS